MTGADPCSQPSSFDPVILATVRLSQVKVWVWPSVLLMLGSLILVLASNILRNQALNGIRWGFLAAFFALAAVGLFSYLKNSRSITLAHLFTAVNIYLLLGMLWAAIYCAIDAFYPGLDPVGKSSSRSSERAALFQPDNALDDWLWRCSAGWWGDANAGGTRRG